MRRDPSTDGKLTVSAPARLLTTIERNGQRMWALCYRMTGRRADADDLTQESITRAIERAAQLTADDPTGWLLAIATRTSRSSCSA
jgi:DNA-directed RNA polymerase specialized sigma24 family protein